MDKKLKTYLNQRRRWPSLLFALFASGIFGVLFWSSLFGQRLETHFGLELAFWLRGPRPAPTETVYIPISHETADILGQDTIYSMGNWNRGLFAELVNRLSEKGVAIVVFDIMFAKEHDQTSDTKRAETDENFVEAIKRAKNVVLLNWVEQYRFGLAGENSVQINIDEMQKPASSFADNATATAPMVFHKEVRANRFETFPVIAFKTTPAVPTVTLYLHQIKNHDQALIAQCIGIDDKLNNGSTQDKRSAIDLSDEVMAVRETLLYLHRQDNSDRKIPECDALQSSVLDRFFSQKSERYFNFYGKPGTLAGPAFHYLAFGEKKLKREIKLARQLVRHLKTKYGQEKKSIREANEPGDNCAQARMLAEQLAKEINFKYEKKKSQDDSCDRAITLAAQLVKNLANKYENTGKRYVQQEKAVECEQVIKPACQLAKVLEYKYKKIKDEADELAESLQGKVVFVGIADNKSVKPPDSFDFVFQNEHGNKGISGVEVVATAFANLLHDDDIKKVEPFQGLILLMMYGAVVGLVTYFLPTKLALVSVSVFASFYAIGASYLFINDNLWLPIIVPLFIQAPFIVAFGWLSKLLATEKLANTLKKFLSKWLIRKVSKGEVVSTKPEVMHGICLHSDVAGYTTLSERMGPDPLPLKQLEKEYWQLVDAEIEAQNGERLEIAGDGMMCIWTASSPTEDLKARACRAALNMQRGIDRFNARHAKTPFKTRIGLHAGSVALGLIGGEGQYTLAVGGDIANSAARLENDVNKLLGTRLIISDSVAADFDFVDIRRVGTFVLRGKSKVIAAYEIPESGYSPPIDFARFQEALTIFDSGNWEYAKRLFGSLLADYPEDGPSRFYEKLLEIYISGLQQPSAGTKPGMIDMNEKWLKDEFGV